jgi:hypothetical protein
LSQWWNWKSIAKGEAKMKLAILAALAAGILMLTGAVQAFADPSLNNGDDLVVCCKKLIPPGQADDLVPGIRAQAEGCTAIDGSAKSINKCPGAVLGCAESAFLCVKGICGCSNPLDGAFVGLTR